MGLKVPMNYNSVASSNNNINYINENNTTVLALNKK